MKYKSFARPQSNDPERAQRVEGPSNGRRLAFHSQIELRTQTMHFVYMLQLSNHQIYVGSTCNVQRRLAEHLRGTGCKTTSKVNSLKLIFSEEHPTKKLAIQRERQIKRWTRAKKVALAQGDLQLLKTL